MEPTLRDLIVKLVREEISHAVKELVREAALSPEMKLANPPPDEEKTDAAPARFSRESPNSKRRKLAGTTANGRTILATAGYNPRGRTRVRVLCHTCQTDSVVTLEAFNRNACAVCAQASPERRAQLLENLKAGEERVLEALRRLLAPGQRSVEPVAVWLDLVGNAASTKRDLAGTFGRIRARGTPDFSLEREYEYLPDGTRVTRWAIERKAG